MKQLSEKEKHTEREWEVYGMFFSDIELCNIVGSEDYSKISSGMEKLGSTKLTQAVLRDIVGVDVFPKILNERFKRENEKRKDLERAITQMEGLNNFIN